MTKEEAKIFLLQLHTDKQLNKSEHEALRIAIKVLEQEPCADVISRQAVIDTIELWLSCDDYNEAERHIMRAVQSVLYDSPSVNLQPICESVRGMQDDAISRQAVLKAIDVKAWEFCDYLIRNSRNDEQKPVSHFADNLREYVGEDLPPVTPQPKTGHWEWVQYDGNPNIGNWHCSECRHIAVACVSKNDKGGVPIHKYCPNCGAKMVEPQESEK